MATELEQLNYVPAVFGEFHFSKRNGSTGAWVMTLAHDLVLAEDSADTHGHLIKAGTKITLPVGSFYRSVFIGAFATAYPDMWDDEAHPVRKLTEERLAALGPRQSLPSDEVDVSF